MFEPTRIDDPEEIALLFGAVAGEVTECEFWSDSDLLPLDDLDFVPDVPEDYPRFTSRVQEVRFRLRGHRWKVTIGQVDRRLRAALRDPEELAREVRPATSNRPAVDEVAPLYWVDAMYWNFLPSEGEEGLAVERIRCAQAEIRDRLREGYELCGGAVTLSVERSLGIDSLALPPEQWERVLEPVAVEPRAGSDPGILRELLATVITNEIPAFLGTGS